MTHDLYDVMKYNSSIIVLYISHGFLYGHVDDTKASEKATHILLKGLLNPPL